MAINCSLMEMETKKEKRIAGVKKGLAEKENPQRSLTSGDNPVYSWL
jgi:hypothetical protein